MSKSDLDSFICHLDAVLQDERFSFAQYVLLQLERDDSAVMRDWAHLGLEPSLLEDLAADTGHVLPEWL